MLLLNSHWVILQRSYFSHIDLSRLVDEIRIEFTHLLNIEGGKSPYYGYLSEYLGDQISSCIDLDENFKPMLNKEGALAILRKECFIS